MSREQRARSVQQSAMVQWVSLVICVIAGVWTVFHIIWNLQGQTADDYWGQALLVLFILALILAVLRYVQERPALVATTPREQFPDPPITRFFLGSTGAAALWFVLRMNVGAQWFLAGWEKVHDPAWGTSGKAMTGFVRAAISKSAGSNPSVQGWYASFLQNFVLPDAGLFSFLVT